MIRRIEPMVAAKVMGIVYTVIGVVIGIIFAVISLLGGMAADRPLAAGFGRGYGVAMIIIMPIIYGCMGFIMTLIIASVYNWAAGIAGGIRIETD